MTGVPESAGIGIEDSVVAGLMLAEVAGACMPGVAGIAGVWGMAFVAGDSDVPVFAARRL